MDSLKHLFNIAIITVALLLASIILLGVRQQHLRGDYTQIISDSETILFQFSTLREEITASIIDEDWNKITISTDRIQLISQSLNRLFDDPLIPGEYKLAVSGKIDLARLAVTTRALPSSPDKPQASHELQEQLRTIAEQLMQFDRVIVSKLKARVVDFQRLFITILSLIIALISLSLVTVYRKGILPMVTLAEQARSPALLTQPLPVLPGACREIREFTELINQRLNTGQPGCEQQIQEIIHEQEEQLNIIINNSTNTLNGIINVSQLLSDSFTEQELTPDQQKLLAQIIKDGERMAALLKRP